MLRRKQKQLRKTLPNSFQSLDKNYATQVCGPTNLANAPFKIYIESEGQKILERSNMNMFPHLVFLKDLNGNFLSVFKKFTLSFSLSRSFYPVPPPPPPTSDVNENLEGNFWKKGKINYSKQLSPSILKLALSSSTNSQLPTSFFSLLLFFFLWMPTKCRSFYLKLNNTFVYFKYIKGYSSRLMCLNVATRKTGTFWYSLIFQHLKRGVRLT